MILVHFGNEKLLAREHETPEQQKLRQARDRVISFDSFIMFLFYLRKIMNKN